MFFIRELTALSNIGLLFLLKLLLLALLLLLPLLNLVLRVVCHDALFLNTTKCRLALIAAAIAAGAEETNDTTYNPFNSVSGSPTPRVARAERGGCWSRRRSQAPSP